MEPIGSLTFQRIMIALRRMVLTSCCCIANVLSESLRVEILPMKRTNVGFPLSPTDEVMGQRRVYFAVRSTTKTSVELQIKGATRRFLRILQPRHAELKMSYDTCNYPKSQHT